MGGDFNKDIEYIIELGLLELFEVIPHTAKPGSVTCASGEGSHIDHFLTDTTMCPMLSQAEVVHGLPFRPHFGMTTTITTHDAFLPVRVLQRTCPLPVLGPNGTYAVMPWSKAANEAARVCRTKTVDDIPEWLQHLDHVKTAEATDLANQYAILMRAIEIQACHTDNLITVAQRAKHEGRGEFPLFKTTITVQSVPQGQCYRCDNLNFANGLLGAIHV